jgi:hypothetical protein
MNGIIENSEVILVDLNEVASVSVEGTCGCAGSSPFSRKMDSTTYLTISELNRTFLSSWSEAQFTPKGNLLIPGTQKVYAVHKQDADKRMSFAPRDIDTVQTDIKNFYNIYRSTNDALDPLLGQALALAIKSYYGSNGLQKKIEEKVLENLQDKIYKSKAFGPLLEKWSNLRFSINKISGHIIEFYAPDVIATCLPAFTFCPKNEKLKITVTTKDGETLNYCKSGLISMNPKSDFGYAITKITTTEDLLNDPFPDWAGPLQTNSVAYQAGLLVSMQQMLRSPNPGRLGQYNPAGGSGVQFRFRLSPSKTNLFNIQIIIPIGSGPEFGQNWFYTPILEVTVSPDAIATTYNQYLNLIAAQKAAAEAQRQANRAVLLTEASTPPTNIGIDPTAPVTTTNPVDQTVTDPVTNTGSSGQGSGWSPGAQSEAL